MSIGVSKIVPFNFPYFTYLIIYIKRSKIGVRGKELKKGQQVQQPVASFASSCFREMTCFSQARRKVRKTVERCFLRRRKRWRKGSFFRGKRSVFGTSRRHIVFAEVILIRNGSDRSVLPRRVRLFRREGLPGFVFDRAHRRDPLVRFSGGGRKNLRRAAGDSFSPLRVPGSV